MVQALDAQIIENFALLPTHVQAWHRLHGEDARVDALPVAEGSVTADAFAARIDALPEPQQPYALALYANAVQSKLERMSSPETEAVSD